MKQHRYAVIFLITFTTNILFSLFFPRPLFILDAEEYHLYATNMLEGRRFEVFPDGRPLHPLRPPMYPIFVAVIYFLFGTFRLPVYFFQILLTGIVSVLIYSLSMKIFNNKNSAFLSSILFSLHLPTLINSAIYYPQALFSFTLMLCITSIYFAFKKPTLFRFMTSGFILGVTALVKPVVQFLAFIIMMVYFSI